MNSHESTADPAIIERDIVQTRASLHRKIDELQHRLSPREQMRVQAARVNEQVRVQAERVKSAVRSVDPTPYAGAAALAAVGVGAAMAVRGLSRRSHAEVEPIAPDECDFVGE